MWAASIGLKSDQGLDLTSPCGHPEAVSSKSTRRLLEDTPADAIVWVVDDDESVRRSLTRLFRSAQLAVEAFPSAMAFLGRAPYDGPSCLVLDVRMRGLDGIALQQELADRDAQIVSSPGMEACQCARKR
jgi:PleD family two-component response regulator